MDRLPFQAAALDEQLRGRFVSHVDPLCEKDSITIEIQHGGKTKAAVVEGRIVGVYAHGVLFQGPFTREFLAYVDFYTGHVRVRSGAVKNAIAAMLPQLYNLALMTARERPRVVGFSA